MKRSSIAELLKSDKFLNEVKVKGWVRTFRSNRFIALNDGSTLNNIQCVVDFETFEESLLKRITTGAAIAVKGTLIESQGKGQTVEIQVSEIKILGDSDPEIYPIQPKHHSLEFLRENAHLRIRTNTFASVMRVRSTLSYAIHKYFTDNGFYNVHTPIITGSDAEGAGEMFTVTTLDLNNPKRNESGQIDFSEDFFGKNTNLTVSGQLEAETFAMALSKVYTFGPTFRAENSNTSRHLAEFWMIEPEVAFNDLMDNMDLAEDFIKYVIKYVLNNCPDDLAFLEQRLIQEDKSKPQNQRAEMAL
ncbi:MAG TPA: asparagine--tRNA ligase, partial [Flavobacteriaceae bacterium]|nr:asparagine--tRNA ligase [Flavobacteriaceae bacterium]